MIPARLAIAERWSVLRRGLTGVLGAAHHVVADVEDVADLRDVVREHRVDLVLIGDDAGLDLPTVVPLFVEVLGVPVAVLCDDLDAEALRALLRGGACAVISKKVDDDALLGDIERLLRGERVVDQRFLPLLFTSDDLEPVHDASSDLLTSREREVLAELARGASNREIASTLVVGESTVKTHLGRIYSKLEVTSRHHAVGRALELGLLS